MSRTSSLDEHRFTCSSSIGLGYNIVRLGVAITTPGFGEFQLVASSIETTQLTDSKDVSIRSSCNLGVSEELEVQQLKYLCIISLGPKHRYNSAE